MKTNINLIKKFNIIFLLIPSFIICSCTGQASDEKVQLAYELRMEGKVDSAKALLEEIVNEDSTSAMAWYELARTKHHMGLGNPRELMGSLDDIQNTIQNAVDLENSNEIYSFYYGVVSYTRAYVSLMRGNPDAEEKVNEVISAFENVLIQKPDYSEAMLYLVEILSLPDSMGGDPLKAEEYATKLENIDVVYGAKARELLLSEDVNKVDFWQKIKESEANNPDLEESLGKAYLYEGNIEDAIICFEKAISLDSTKNILHVDIGRYYLMQAMQNPAKLDSVTPLITNEFEIYLNSKPEPANHLRAYVIGQLANINFRVGENEKGNKLLEEANNLDPYYSKAFAIPSQILFDPPNEIIHDHVYFSRPF